jgi:hypothetical protein
MRTFSITWDYRCPFARNAHEHVLVGLAAGADWDVTFVPFSLGQTHVADDEPPIWDRPDDDSGLLALQVGTAVRELAPSRFATVHRDLFALRHDHGGDLRDRGALAEVLDRHGVDGAAVFAHVDDGRALKILRDEHEAAVADHRVWGVPTFVSGGQAVFVRLMHRPDDDAQGAVDTIERVLHLMNGFSDLNEFKHTSIPR